MRERFSRRFQSSIADPDPIDSLALIIIILTEHKKDRLSFIEACTDLDSLVDSNHSVLKSSLDAYAPEKTCRVVHRPCAPWYSDDISVQKNIRRKLERKWRSSKLPVNRECYVFQNGVVNNMIALAKQNYYSSKIQENSGNTGILFRTVEKLLNSNPA